jgi:hypothetical protein
MKIAFFCATTSCVLIRAYPPIQLLGVIIQKTQEFVYLRFTATGAPPGCEAHTNFAGKSICLLADNIRTEEITIHRSQEVLKMLDL